MTNAITSFFTLSRTFSVFSWYQHDSLFLPGSPSPEHFWFYNLLYNLTCYHQILRTVQDLLVGHEHSHWFVSNNIYLLLPILDMILSSCVHSAMSKPSTNATGTPQCATTMLKFAPATMRSWLTLTLIWQPYSETIISACWTRIPTLASRIKTPLVWVLSICRRRPRTTHWLQSNALWLAHYLSPVKQATIWNSE